MMRHRGFTLVELPAGAVAIAPPAHVSPVHEVCLQGDYAPAVVLILEPARPRRPEKLRHDHVLHGRHPDRAEWQGQTIPAVESLAVVGVVGEQKQLHPKRRISNRAEVHPARGHRLELHLRLEANGFRERTRRCRRFVPPAVTRGRSHRRRWPAARRRRWWRANPTPCRESRRRLQHSHERDHSLVGVHRAASSRRKTASPPQQGEDRGVVGRGMPLPQPGTGQHAGPLEEPRARQKLLATIERPGRDDTTAEDLGGGAGEIGRHAGLMWCCGWSLRGSRQSPSFQRTPEPRSDTDWPAGDRLFPAGRGRRRHARLGEQRVFSRCQCPDHTHRPRLAKLLSGSEHLLRYSARPPFSRRTASGRPTRPISLLKGSPSADRPLRKCHGRAFFQPKTGGWPVASSTESQRSPSGQTWLRRLTARCHRDVDVAAPPAADHHLRAPGHRRMHGVLGQPQAVDAVEGVGLDAADHVARVDVFEVELDAARPRSGRRSACGERCRCRGASCCPRHRRPPPRPARDPARPLRPPRSRHGRGRWTRAEQVVEKAAGAVEGERHLRDQHVVGIGLGQCRVAGDEAGVTPHQLDEADAVGRGLGLDVGRADALGGLGERGLEAERLVDVGDVVVDRLGDADDRDSAPPLAGRRSAICIAPRSVPSPPITNRTSMFCRSRQSTIASGSCARGRCRGSCRRPRRSG